MNGPSGQLGPLEGKSVNDDPSHSTVGVCSVTGQLGDQAGPLRHCSCGVWFRPTKWNQKACSRKCSNATYNAANPVTRQGSLFEERPRLAHQCGAILERVARGRVTNSELARMALNYRARISELRQAGHDVRVVERNRKTGLVWYGLFAAGRELTL